MTSICHAPGNPVEKPLGLFSNFRSAIVTVLEKEFIKQPHNSVLTGLRGRSARGSRLCVPTRNMVLFLISPQEISDEYQPQGGYDPDIHVEQKLLR